MPLAWCVAPLSGFLSHWNTRQYSPLLVLIKIIIVKFLLKITTMKIQSDCFGIKCSRKRPTDVASSGLYTYNTYMVIYYHTWRWNAITDTKFQPPLLDKKVSKCGYFWVLLRLHNIQDFNFSGVRSTFGRLQHIIQNIVNIYDLVVGHWTLCDKKTEWNKEK